jgi:hypothetical protein
MKARSGAARGLKLAVGILIAFALPGSGIADAHKGSVNYRSTVRSVEPAVQGLKIQVLNYDDRLQIVNQTGRQVDVRGYGGEPYVRVKPDGTVEVNKRSPSYWLNEDRYGNAKVPAQATNSAAPQWDVVDKTGRYEWHDHRIHYMSKSTPKQVTDKGKRTKVFDWRVPIAVAGKPGRIRGDLYWVPTSGGLSRGALLGLAAIVIAGVFLVEVVRRRRARQHDASPRGTSEAWG